MSYRVTVEEIVQTPISGIDAHMPDAPVLVKRYEQTVDAIDLRAVMAAVNHVPRKPRTLKPKVTP